MHARQRTAALLEVLGVYLAGQLVTEQLIRLLGVQVANPLAGFTAEISDAALLTATRQLFVLLVLQYAGWFLLIIPINWWHRRRGPVAYGLTRAGRSWTALILAGIGTVVTVSLVVWPASTLLLVDAIYDLNLGETVPWREALFETSMRRWEFWLFMAVLSFGFVAVVEELFFRGYCQRRVAEDWGDGPAIVGTALLFTFVHRQYLMPNVYNLSMIASLLILAIGFGVVFAWTRSLIPSIVAHAIINVPMTPIWGAVALTAYVIAGVLTRRRGLAVIKHVFSDASVARCVALGVIGVGYAIASQRIEGLVFAAATMVIVALVLEAVDRRSDGVLEGASLRV